MVKRALALLALASCACGSETSVIVVVDSDLSVPEELALVRVVVQEATVTDFVLDADGGPTLPFSFAIVPAESSEPDRALVVEGIGLDAERSQVLSIELTTSFVAGETVQLPLALDRTCVPRACDRAIDASTLERIEPGEEI